jgi:protein-disulfide isomerase
MLYPAELRGQGHASAWVSTTAGLIPDRLNRGTYLGAVEQKPVKVASVSSSVEDDEADLTRKQRREQARAQRKELEEAEAASAVRRTRLTRLGVIVAVVVAAIVAILIATGSGSKGGLKHGKGAEPVVNEVTAAVGGVPQNGNVLGDPKAPVTLQYFGDLECPVCKVFTLGALPSIIGQWVRSGKLKIEYHSMQTATREPEVFKNQQVAALAAGKQGKMWNFLELFYHEQGEENTGYVTEGYLQGLAQQVPGLNLTKWTSDRGEPALMNQLETDAQTVNTEGFTGTPAFLLGKSGTTLQKLEPGTYTEAAPYNAAIEKALKT